jgi:hypothetical protein
MCPPQVSASGRTPGNLACFLQFGSTLATILALVAGCGSSGPSSVSNTGKKAPLGASCKSDTECASGKCLIFHRPSIPGTSDLTYCSTSCDVGCEGTMVCGTAADGSKACMMSCAEPNRSYTEAYACKDNVPTACSVLDQTYCLDCKNCPSTLRCEPGVGCQPRREVGEACTNDQDCKSDNCSAYLGVCRVPVWSVCTADNCDYCTTSTNGTVFCARACGDNINSNVCGGGYCISGHCYTTCDTCPLDQCTTLTDINYQSYRYCKCQDCTVSTAPRPLGIECSQDSACASSNCLHNFCSQRCSSDTDCSAAGLVCAQLSCTGSTTNDCGSLCLHPCDADGTCKTHGGNCNALPTPAGATISACDIREDIGASCQDNDNCLSGRCINLACAPANGLANGSPCARPSDCASANCINGECLGKAMIGDPCTTSADCSVGTCCTGTSACATTC